MQIHRSLVEAKDGSDSEDLFPALRTLPESERQCMFSLVLYGQLPLTLLAKAPTATDKCARVRVFACVRLYPCFMMCSSESALLRHHDCSVVFASW